MAIILTNEQNFIQKGNIMKLDTGDIFPSLSGMTINGELQILPQATKTEWTVISGYRAHW